MLLGAAAGAAVASLATLAAVQTKAPVEVAPRDPAKVAAGILPRPDLTPGATLPVSKGELCRPGYSRSVRNVPQAEKEGVYFAYGIRTRKPGEYEIDHLISLELGGSNDKSNLWAEPYDVDYQGLQMGAHEKDKAENAAHWQVCAGNITLASAQQQIANDWTVLYRLYVSPTFPKWQGKPVASGEMP
jgi:hypothetical protein